MRSSHTSVTAVQIRDADIIWAFDPARPKEQWQQVYGQESMAKVQMPGMPAYRLQVLEIEFDSTNPDELQAVLRQVKSVKGGLPQVVQPLLRA